MHKLPRTVCLALPRVLPPPHRRLGACLAALRRRLAEALDDGNYVLAQIFQDDLEAVKENLGLPRYGVGQSVQHQYRDGLRGIVIDVDLTCQKSPAWVSAAGCLERGCALGYPAEETEHRALLEWAQQPFYTVLPDLTDAADESVEKGHWRWRWPRELAAWEVNVYKEVAAALYIPQDALTHDPAVERAPVNPEISQLFDGFDATPHRGRLYKPAPRLRLWQQQRQAEHQESAQRRKATVVGSVNPYDAMR